jgi:hypothetical protein
MIFPFYLCVLKLEFQHLNRTYDRFEHFRRNLRVISVVLAELPECSADPSHFPASALRTNAAMYELLWVCNFGFL